MAYNHNLLGSIVKPTSPSLVEHDIWKGKANLSGEYTATIRGVDKDTKNGALYFTCVDPHGIIFEMLASCVTIVS